MKRLMLKEVFLAEEPKSSRFVESMRKQLGRVKDQEGLDYVVSVYDSILTLIQQRSMRPSREENRQAILRNETPFYKFHYRIAYQEYQNGKLDPKAVPTGQEMLESELEKRNIAQAEQQAKQAAAQAKSDARTPEEKAAAQKRAVYGGDPNERPWGLGS